MKARRGAAKIAALVMYIIVVLVATPQAQQPASSRVEGPIAFAGSPGAVNAGPAAAATDATAVDLLVGRSTILNTGSAIARVSLTVPDVADAMVTAPSQLLIHGKTPGTISLFVWDRAGGIKTYEVSVRRDLTHLIAQLKELFPGESLTVMGSGKDVVLSGTVTSKYVIDKAAEVAGGYVEKKEYVVNLLKQIEGQASNQVMLRVRFAEVSRSALRELGSSFFTGPGGFHDYVAQVSTQQFPTIHYDELSRMSIQGPGNWGGGRDTVDSTGGKYTFSDMLNFMVFNNKYNIGTLIKAMQDKGLFQSLAEPNLIALNGKEASFLAGGEYPYPVVQPGAGGNAITIMFKEFGVRLNFTPTVLGGDLINLKVRPEVSSLDFSNAIVLDGFRIPALSTRRTDTEVELQDGQTFAIAGLMNNSVQTTMRKIPGIGDIPILGWLFKSQAVQKNQTELVVMITPHIVRRGSTGVSQGLPTIQEPFMGAPSKRLPQPDAYTGSPRYPGSNQQPRSGGGQAPLADDSMTPPQSASQPAPAPQSAPQSMPQAVTPAPSNVAPFANASVPAPAPTPKVDPKEAARLRDELKKAEEAQKAAEKKAADEKAANDRKAAEEKAANDKKAAAEKAEADRKAAAIRAEAEKKAAAIQAEADKNASTKRERQKKLDAERAKREAEVSKKNQDEERKRQAELKKHEKTLAEAAARLKAAQDAYQAEIKKKGQR
jgi:pilus assembly protein CpaC